MGVSVAIGSARLSSKCVPPHLRYRRALRSSGIQLGRSVRETECCLERLRLPTSERHIYLEPSTLRPSALPTHSHVFDGPQRPHNQAQPRRERKDASIPGQVGYGTAGDQPSPSTP